VKQPTGDRRTLERFDLSAPARVTLESEAGGQEPLDLVTKDVSSAGAFLYCPQHLVEGARVRMELLILPDTLSKSNGETGRAKVKVRGTIIRADTDGIAIRFESRFKITALEDGSPENRLY
jgi:hypothetical protein